MKPKYKKIFFVVLALIILIVLFLYFGKRAEVQVYTAVKQKFEDIVEETGTVKSSGEFQASPIVGGKVLYAAKENQSVKKGDKLFELDTKEYRLKIEELNAQKKGNLAQIDANTPQLYESQVKEAKLGISQTQAELEDAGKNLERSKSLFENGAISKKDLEDARLAYDSLENKLDAGKEKLNLLYESAKPKKGVSEVYTSANEQIDKNIQLLQKQISDASIYSPIDGIVVKSLYKKGESAAPGQPAVIVSSDKAIEIQAMVLTDEVVNVKPGDFARIIQKTSGDDLTGKGEVIKINDYAEDTVSTLGIGEKRVKVTIGVTDAGSLKLASNYEADVEIVTFKKENALVCPNTALFKSGDGDSVFIVKSGRAKSVPVETGLEGKEYTLIKSGINEGDKIIKISDAPGVKNGARVKIIESK